LGRFLFCGELGFEAQETWVRQEEQARRKYGGRRQAMLDEAAQIFY